MSSFYSCLSSPELVPLLSSRCILTSLPISVCSVLSCHLTPFRNLECSHASFRLMSKLPIQRPPGLPQPSFPTLCKPSTQTAVWSRCLKPTALPFPVPLLCSAWSWLPVSAFKTTSPVCTRLQAALHLTLRACGPQLFVAVIHPQLAGPLSSLASHALRVQGPHLTRVYIFHSSVVVSPFLLDKKSDLTSFNPVTKNLETKPDFSKINQLAWLVWLSG